MEQLQVGDCVVAKQLDGSVQPCDRIYMFGHAEANSFGLFQQLQLSSGRSLLLSQRHFIPTRLQMDSEFQNKYSKDVQPGEWAMEEDGISQVISNIAVIKQGLYNPYTKSGLITVDGVVASAHSDWFLDDLIPASMVGYLPTIYQA